MATTYTRPSDWLAMPVVATSSQTFVGLFAVRNNESNYVALRVTTSTGNYQVDWGDGTITTHASNTTAEYLYTYSAISDYTLCSRGYKQALVIVTPVTGNITVLNTNIGHSVLGTTVVKQVKWLEYLINLPSLTSLSISPTGNNPRPNWLEKVTISHLGSLTSLQSTFSSLFGLKAVNITASTTGITSTTNMFMYCYSLISVNLFNTSNVTLANGMFNTCTNGLEQVPNFNLSKSVSANSMFANCLNLKTVPALDLRLATDFSSMLTSCGSLTEIPLIDTRSGTNFTNFASGCAKLKTVANLDMSKAINATSAFQSCRILDNFPAIVVGNTNCILTSFFYSCDALKKVGDIDVSKAITFSNFFNGSSALRTLPALNLNSGTTLTSMVNGVIARAPFINVRASLSVANKNLGRTMIVELFNGLASGVSSKTITVSANPGYTSLTTAERAIATTKGWTIA